MRGCAGWRRLDLRLPLFPSLWREKINKGLLAAPVDHLSEGVGGGGTGDVKKEDGFPLALKRLSTLY